MTRAELTEAAGKFWTAHLKKCDGLGGHTHPDVMADFAASMLEREGAVEHLETLLMHLPDALAEVRKLPDIQDYWLDLAYGVMPCLMVRYDLDDPKTERVRLWSVEQLEEIWAKTRSDSLKGK